MTTPSSDSMHTIQPQADHDSGPVPATMRALVLDGPGLSIFRSGAFLRPSRVLHNCWLAWMQRASAHHSLSSSSKDRSTI